MNSLSLAIAILNYNGLKWLELFIPSIVQYSQGHTVYLIDNGSTDDSINWIILHYPEIKIIENKKNEGFAGGYNQGLKKIKEDIYCLLNSDVEVTKDWTVPILNIFEKEPNTAAVQPKILDYNKRDQFEYAGAAGGFIDNLGYPYCRGRMFFDLEKDNGQYDDEYSIFWATGACLFVRKDDFWAVGGFDEKYFAHMEEIDLCWRLKNEGKDIKYCGKSTVYHVGGGTLDQNSPQKTYLNLRNSLFNLVKNLPKGKVVPVVFQRMALDGLAAFYFLFKNGFPHFWAVVRAHFSFYQNLPTLLKQRKAGLPQYFNQKNIVLKYFLEGKKQSTAKKP